MAQPAALIESSKSSTRLSGKAAMVFCFLCLIAGLLLRWWKLGSQSFWFDEGYTAWLSPLSPARILQLLRGDVGAPLHYLLIHFWRMFAGDSERALRSLSAICSTLALLVFVDLARRVVKHPWAVASAAGLFALSAMQVQYAQEARYYGLLSLLSVAALDCMAISAAQRRPSALIGLAVSLSAALYTHNVMLLYWVGLNVAWVCWPGRPLRNRWVEMLLVNLAVAAIYAPWTPTLLAQIDWARGRFWLPVPSLMDAWYTLAVLLGLKPYLLAGVTGNLPFGDAGHLSKLAVLLLSAALIGGLWRGRHHGLRLWTALVSAGLLPVVMGFVQSHLSQPIFMDRIFIASCAPLALLVALPTARPGRPAMTKLFAISSALLIAGAGLSSILYLSRFEKENWRDACAILSHGQATPRLIVFVGNEGQLPFDYYKSRDGNRLSADETGLPAGFFDSDPPRTVLRIVDERDLQRLKEAIASGRYRQIDLVRAHDWFADPRNLAVGYLHTHWRHIVSEKVKDIQIDRYVPPQSMR